MKINLLNEGALAANSAGIGTVTRKVVRERAVEAAVINGRFGQDVSKSDWEQTKRELTGDSNTDPNEALLEPGASATEGGNGMTQSIYTLMAEQPFFKGLNAHQLQLVAESAMEMQFEQGQTIFREGSPANRFYLILGGKVVLESELKERGMTPIQTLGPGQDLGWSWLFAPYYLHSSARALEQTRTLVFYGTRLREQCEQDHDLGYVLISCITSCARCSFCGE